MLRKFKRLFNALNLWEWVLGISIELLLRIGLVWLWNLIFSAEFNKFLFGTEKLGYIYGVILVTVTMILFGTQQKSQTVVSNHLNMER